MGFAAASSAASARRVLRTRRTGICTCWECLLSHPTVSSCSPQGQTNGHCSNAYENVDPKGSQCGSEPTALGPRVLSPTKGPQALGPSPPDCPIPNVRIGIRSSFQDQAAWIPDVSLPGQRHCTGGAALRTPPHATAYGGHSIGGFVSVGEYMYFCWGFDA